MSILDKTSHWNLFLTFHTLATPHRAREMYFIKWKRGSHKGSTEKCFNNEDGVVNFSKTFQCHCTIFYSKRMKKNKDKILDIEIFKFNQVNKPKKIGSLEFNLANHVGMAPIESQEFKMVNDLKLVLSIKLVQANGTEKRRNSDTEIDSALTLTTDNISQNSNHSPRVKQPNNGKKLDSFFKPADKVKRHLPPEVTSTVTFRMENNFNEQEAINPVNGINELLNLSWPKNNVNICLRKNNPFHGIDVFLFAGLLNYKIFDSRTTIDDGFDKFMEKFIFDLRDSTLLKSLEKYEQFIPLFGLYLLVGNPPHDYNLSISRCNEFCDSFKSILEDSLFKFVDFHTRIFDASITALFKKDADLDQVCTSFISSIQRFNRICQVPSTMTSIVNKALTITLDTVLVNQLVKTPHCCTFIGSLVLNTFCREMREYSVYPMEFLYFQEAIAVIQNTSEIDETPSSITRICPHLPTEAIISVLSARQLDEDLKTLPNLRRFSVFNNIYSTPSQTPIKLNLLSIVDFDCRKISTENWNNTYIEKEIINENAFLTKYFNHT